MKSAAQKQPLVWSTNNDLWFRINIKIGGVLCPNCFNKKAEKIGIYLKWRAEE